MRDKNKRWRLRCLILLAGCLCLSGCSSGEDEPGMEKTPAPTETASAAPGKEIQDTPPAGTRDNTPQVLEPSADGVTVYENEEVRIDASNLAEGYVMVKYMGNAGKVRALLKTPSGDTYNYRLSLDKSYDVLPLSDGSGAYDIGVYENIKDDKYAEIFSQNITAEITDETKTFLYPNQYVTFDASCEAVKKGSELAAGKSKDMEVVTAVYEYVTKNISYDEEKAKTVQSGYLPDVDDTLASGKGICFDYAALMASMLRSQRIPTKLEIGYVDTIYHAWISVYIEDEGWIEDTIYFDGTTWRLMDPTLASYAEAKTIKQHMENSDNYYDLKYKY